MPGDSCFVSSFASDKVGHWETYAGEITKYHTFLKLLSEGTRRKACSDNLLALLEARRAKLRKTG